MIKKLLKYFWILFINIILVLYLSEILLTIFFKTNVTTHIDLDYQRYQKAKESGIDYDTRTGYQAFVEEKEKEPNLEPYYHYHLGYKLINTNENDLIPLRGPINKKILTCLLNNELGIRRIVNNDKHGFKNPNLIYQKKIEVFMIGDSFAQGVCQDENNDIAGVLRNKFKTNTANYGIAGGGPLTSLAALKEYGPNLKPNFVIYFYFEGNEMEDLRWEKETFLVKYLDNYSQNLFNRGEEIKEFLKKHEIAAYEVIKKKSKNFENKFDKKIIIEDVLKKIKKQEKIEIFKDFLELQNLKSFFFTKDFFGHKVTVEKELFNKILLEMKSESAKWSGEFIVVYLPDWNRFYKKYSLAKLLHKQKIENIIKKLDISYIDITKEFEKNRNPINFFPWGLNGHYTAKGYQLVAETIFKNLNK